MKNNEPRLDATWLAIATAPRDGTEVEVRRVGDWSGLHVRWRPAGTYSRDDGPYVVPSGWQVLSKQVWLRDELKGSVPRLPTHWRPLA